ncbi:MAG: O-antigen ligase family protein [Bacteroidales bacterium]|nr:O-antigen ligase family protein [Bacteroidales bacterium]
MFSRRVHQNIYLICLLLAAFLMPVSVWLLSAVSIAMSANWLLEGDYRRKYRTFKSSHRAVILLMLFAMYLLWLLNTADLIGAIGEIKVRLPLLFFPVVLGSSVRPGPRTLRLVLLSFTAGCIVATVAGILALTGVLPVEISSPRDLALFVPSIRLSILLCFAIFSSLWLIMADHAGLALHGIEGAEPGGGAASVGEKKTLTENTVTCSGHAGVSRGREARTAGTGMTSPGSDLTFTAMVWDILNSRRTTLSAGLAVAAAAMSWFLFRLLSVTGIILFVILLVITGIYMIAACRRFLAGMLLLVAAATMTAAAVILMHSAIHAQHHPANPSLNEPMSTTASGTDYTHYPEETLTENGYLVWINVCEEELRKEWNERSGMDYDGPDAAGNELRVTLIRYITFLGMTKDSAAMATLTDMDISGIEKGFANPLYTRKGSPRARAYELAWELHRASSGANPSGHSLTQRPEFYRAAFGIIKEHPWCGVGTGDVAMAFSDEYESNATPLTEEYRLRAHNQYLTFAVTFGIPGMIVAVALIMIPWLRCKCRWSYLFLLFMTVTLVTMFNDDTFSSFTGAAFFSYFYTLLIVTCNRNET